ncbi:methionine ABC transporter ATP-binding protein [Lactiplantibacillus plantarum]|uniref:Methionine ABC transporter ATP-binding protein n=2 Tax=Lactiplantibacillus plantarum TaxID=1590 RepID=A0AAW3RI60_LACPN|nr:ATP-binding cassette domain-containing protein [Lactiplantibacillus plantarum]ASZ34925.1 phosphate ABC transporter ATP-binding protein [Lactiplantibacillus plantarum]ERO39762.1 ABC superfamily ATP binding cassette transporter, binding protein [Lactiplantibacillus plantarum WJL]KPN42580.1 Methionine ABC transporter ATP-binding protein [Lactiplantibacillus plantarum WJL]KZV01261.1 Methionine ABC transporter ATP-binding protein [Lactiplantibacillus plantarum]KZV06390.1 Methionine ABC transport
MIEDISNVIDLKDIRVTFKNSGKDLEAVDDVNLKIKKGDIYGIIGYSGAGKSTLVRVINLLQQPSEGKVIVNGQDLLELKPVKLREARQKIGMIFQHFNLMKSRTVLGNVEYPLLGKKINKQERQEKALNLLKRVGLEKYASTYPQRLSGGQKQRVAIARALATEPEVLISDEATSALDPKTTKAILELLKKLNDELGLTIVLITHEMQVIKSICHNVAVMDEGRIIEQGTVAKVFTDPQEKLTTDFVETSTNVRAAIDRIMATINVADLPDNQELVYFNFIGNATKQSILSELSQTYHVAENILFANIDQIDGENVGYMIAIIEGELIPFNKALEDLRPQRVKTQILSSVPAKEDDA